MLSHFPHEIWKLISQYFLSKPQNDSHHQNNINNLILTNTTLHNIIRPLIKTVIHCKKDTSSIENISFNEKGMIYSNLIRLALQNININSKLLKKIVEESPKIQILDLSYSNIENPYLNHLSNLKQLHTLYLRGCKNITDLGIKYLTSCNNLTDLYVPETAITDGSINSLLQITKLTVLDVRKTKITEAGYYVILLLSSPSFKILCSNYCKDFATTSNNNMKVTPLLNMPQLEIDIDMNIAQQNILREYFNLLFQYGELPDTDHPLINSIGYSILTNKFILSAIEQDVKGVTLILKNNLYITNSPELKH